MNSLAAWLYRSCLGPVTGLGKIRQRIAALLRRGLLKVSDPLCLLEIHGKLLEVPLSHPVALYLAANPRCDTVLRRLGAHLRASGGSLDSIDVGANIGDTIAAVDPRQGEWVMAVEPHPAYAVVLRRNAARFPAEIEVVEKACVDGSSPASVVVEATSGTGALRTVESGGLPTTTLDLLYEGTARMKGVRLLKVDVDGFDFTVLRGGGRFLAEVRPVVLMESDVFGNESYLEDLEELILRMKGCGYRDLVIYDNYGNLFSVLRLEGIEPLLPALFYQATAGKIYYDLVFGVDLGDFISSELAHFQASARDETRRRVGEKIARRWSRDRNGAQAAEAANL